MTERLIGLAVLCCLALPALAHAQPEPGAAAETEPSPPVPEVRSEAESEAESESESDAEAESESEAESDADSESESEMTDEEAEAAYLAAMYGSDESSADSDDEAAANVPPIGAADYLGYTGLGLGVLAMTGGLVTLMLAPRSFERAEAGGPGADALRSEGEALEISAAVLFAAGGALALAGLITLFIKYEEREAAMYGQLEIRLGPGGLLVSGTF